MDYIKLVELYEKIENTSKRLEKTYLISEFIRDVDIDELFHLVLLLQGKVFSSMDGKKLGVATSLVIKALNISLGVEKSLIENTWKTTGDLGLTAEKLCAKK